MADQKNIYTASSPHHTLASRRDRTGARGRKKARNFPSGPPLLASLFPLQLPLITSPYGKKIATVEPQAYIQATRRVGVHATDRWPQSYQPLLISAAGL